jgi:hypothetical protein
MLSKEKLKELVKLKTKKGRKTQRRLLVEGLRLCEEIANSIVSRLNRREKASTKIREKKR